MRHYAVYDETEQMVIFKKVKDLQLYLQHINASQLKVGFTPTMGALHAGHLSLIEQSLKDSTLTICSIFVNPTQFNQKEDLASYPVTIDKDIHLLEKVGCDILFLPGVDEIYPAGLKTEVNIDLEGLDEVMEGAQRPGHFEGVVQVVRRLLDIVQPDELYMGQKDFQQLAIIRRMVKVLDLPMLVVGVPIKREESGLAMSSRNVRLSNQDKKNALAISKVLSFIQKKAGEKAIDFVEKEAIRRLKKAGLKPEYVEIVNQETLQALTDFKKVRKAQACIAVWAGEVRLIDNCEVLI